MHTKSLAYIIAHHDSPQSIERMYEHLLGLLSTLAFADLSPEELERRLAWADSIVTAIKLYDGKISSATYDDPMCKTAWIQLCTACSASDHTPPAMPVPPELELHRGPAMVYNYLQEHEERRTLAMSRVGGPLMKSNLRRRSSG